MKNQGGQSLIEVLVALIVVMIMVVALIVVILGSLKNSQFAQKQVQATKYAQEAIDKVRAIRDREGKIDFYAPPESGCMSECMAPGCPFSTLWACEISNPMTSPCTTLHSGDTPGSGCYLLFSSSSNDTNLSEPSSENNIGYPIPNENMKREIFIEDLGEPTEKKVTVKVTWTDSSGEHESNLQTILTQH